MSYPTYSDLELEIQKLEEENKKLKEERDSWKEYQHRSQSADGEQIERLLGEKIKLEEENRKLKSDLNLVIDERDNAFKKIEQLKEELGKFIMKS